MTEPLAGGTAAAPFSMRAAASLTSAVVRAARQLLTDLERGRRIDAAVLRGATEAAFGASDATGAWNWKIAYDACEVATVLFLRKFGSAIRARSGSPPAMLSMLAKIAGLLPTHTRRSLESEAPQQFSTPSHLAWWHAPRLAQRPPTAFLGPSAGTGFLAIFAELAGGAVVLNELAGARASTSPSPTRKATSAPGLSIATANRSRAGKPSRAAVRLIENSPRCRRCLGRWIRSSSASARIWSPK